MLPPSHRLTSVCHVFLALSYIYPVISPACFCLCCHMFTLSIEKPQERVDRGLVLKAKVLIKFWHTFDGWPTLQIEKNSVSEKPHTESLGGNVTWFTGSVCQSQAWGEVSAVRSRSNVFKNSRVILMSSQDWEQLHQLFCYAKVRRRNWQGVRASYITRRFGGLLSAGFHTSSDWCWTDLKLLGLLHRASLWALQKVLGASSLPCCEDPLLADPPHPSSAHTTSFSRLSPLPYC